MLFFSNCAVPIFKINNDLSTKPMYLKNSFIFVYMYVNWKQRIENILGKRTILFKRENSSQNIKVYLVLSVR